MKFYRNPPPFRSTDYSRYRQYTRRDFERICAHCFRHELEVGGEEHFVQDHFEPKCRPSVDPSDYLNLYWSCTGCNRYKGSHWPSPERVAKGEVFCDACDHDPIGTDYALRDDGELEALTPAGTYTIRHIGLNERPALMHSRRQRKSTRQCYKQLLLKLRQELQAWPGEGRSTETEERYQRLLELLRAYESYVARDPFMLDSVPPEVPREVLNSI